MLFLRNFIIDGKKSQFLKRNNDSSFFDASNSNEIIDLKTKFIKKYEKIEEKKNESEREKKEIIGKSKFILFTTFLKKISSYVRSFLLCYRNWKIKDHFITILFSAAFIADIVLLFKLIFVKINKNFFKKSFYFQ